MRMKTNVRKIEKVLFSVVALVLIIAVSSLSISAWIETTSSLKIIGSGNIDNYTYHIANIGSGSDYTEKLNLDSYFYKSGGIHLASASSANGEDFYFPILNTSPQKYRKANINDANVNYISFQIKVKAVTGNLDFYFNTVPVIKIGDDIIDDNLVRFAIGTSQGTKIFSNKAKTESVVSASDGAKKSTEVFDFESHSNEGESEIFSVANGATEIVTISMWLQNPEMNTTYEGHTVTVENFELITGSAKTTKIKFIDRTTAFNGTKADSTESSNGWHWINNDNAVMWVYHSGLNKSVKMELDSADATNTTWVAKIPGEFYDNKQADLYFYRCEDVATNPLDIYYNSWKTTLSDAINSDSIKYTAYGTKNSSDIGYGTWDKVAKVTFATDKTANTSFLPMVGLADETTATHITLTDKSSGIAENIQMNYHSEDGTNNTVKWIAYIPENSSADITFSFKINSKEYSYKLTNKEIKASSNNDYLITSSSTGYWSPAVKAEALMGNGMTSAMGSVSVSGGVSGATSALVTSGTKVTFTATAKGSYDFVGWYKESSLTTQIKTDNPYEVTVNNDTKLYAKFAVKTYSVTAYAVTDGTNENDTGGTVKIGTNGTASAKAESTANHGSTVTLYASKKNGYDFEGWYSEKTGGTKLSVDDSVTYTVNNISDNVKAYARFKKSTQTVYIGVISYQSSIAYAGTLKMHYWGGSSGSGDAVATSLGTTVQFSPGSGYWSGAKQTFTMYKAELPPDAVSMKAWADKDSGYWYGGDSVISNGNCLMLFEYGGVNRANQINYPIQ
ncbi:MAG: InlB B-repeat-containing protein [Ruminococcus sp.]|nr:InlB B-repeat-containing protein [Ruminococcus sp.]